MTTKQILTGITIAILALGVAVPLAQQNVFAPSLLKIIGVNKMASTDPNHCSHIDNFLIGAPSGSVNTSPAALVNCSGTPSDGSVFSRNTASPHLLLNKDHLQNGDHVTIRMVDESLNEEDANLDSYQYTIHDLDTINEVQIRVCDGSATDSICASQRVIAENP